MNAMKASARVATGLFAAMAGTAWADSEPVRWQLNMPEGVTRTAQNAYEMHMLGLWICVAIAVVVFGAMIVAAMKFRKSKGAQPDVDFTHSTKLEAVWTTIPILILILMAVPATSRNWMRSTRGSRRSMARRKSAGVSNGPRLRHWA